jgi:hypothetical protein
MELQSLILEIDILHVRIAAIGLCLVELGLSNKSETVFKKETLCCASPKGSAWTCQGILTTTGSCLGDNMFANVEPVNQGKLLKGFY